MNHIEGTRPNSSFRVKCFRCLGLRHHQIDYQNEPVRYKCKQKGHMVVNCKILKAKKLKMYGIGIPSHGFYAFDFLEAN